MGSCGQQSLVAQCGRISLKQVTILNMNAVYTPVEDSGGAHVQYY